MKRNSSKLISLALTICLIVSMVVTVNSGSVLADSPSTATNLIAGTTPTDFYRATIGTPSNRSQYQWNDFGIANIGNKFGYFYNWTDQKANIVNYIATATDSNPNAGNAYYLDKSYVLIYDLGQYASLDSISISFGDQSYASNAAAFKVYAATSRADIFNATPTEFSQAWGTSASANLSGIARFVAIVVEKHPNVSTLRYIALKNIVLNGSFVNNVIDGALPIRFCSVNKDAFAFNWSTTKVTKDGATYNNHGFTETDGFGRRNDFAPYLSLFTDGDEAKQLTIEPEDRNKSYVLIAYELPDACNLKGIELFSNGYTSKFDIYASTSKSTLFDSANKVGNIQRADNAYSTPNLVETNIENAKFIGIYMNYTYQTGICEIRAYATDTGLSPNILVGCSPVAGYGVTKGTTTPSYHCVRTNDSDANQFGSGTAPSSSANATFTTNVGKFTDGLTATGATTIYNEYKSDEDVLLAYKLNEMSSVNNVTFLSDAYIRTVYIYMSNSFTNLFKSNSLVTTYTTDNTTTNVSIDLAKAKNVLYVGFVIDADKDYGQKLQEIIVRGVPTSSITAQTSSVTGTLTNNANAYTEAKNFYNYLKYLGNGNGTLLGAEINVDEYGDTTKRAVNDNYYEFLESTYGVTPKIVSSHIDESKMSVDRVKRYYQEGSIPMFSAGISSATIDALDNKTGSIKYCDNTYSPSLTEKTTYSSVQTEVTASYKQQADFFEALENAGVKAYIVRPFIEMNIKGQYGNTSKNALNQYEYDTRQNFKNVWQQMYNYFVNTRGLKGIIFAFAPCATSGSKMFAPMDYYPGDNYVDIIAPTCYSQTNDGNLPDVTDYSNMIATGKPFAFSEIGLIKSYDVTTRTNCMNMLSSVKTKYPTATFINLWYGNNYSINVHSNAEAFIHDSYLVSYDRTNQFNYGTAGDLDENGVIDVVDLVIMDKENAKVTNTHNILMADYNRDRSINDTDVCALSSFILQN